MHPPSNTFVGRERELATLRELVTSRRLVTLLGAGGAGKTRLAQHLAAGLGGADFPDGVWFVDLVPVQDPTRVGQALLDALALRDEAGAGAAAVVGESLAQARALVVLDNCEHVVDATADLVVALLASCPGLSVLATSREPLRVAGEQLVRVSGLDESAADLFAARAGEATGAFVLDADNRPAVTALVTRLDGLPLAIELAAARLRALTLAELAQRLEARYELLASPRRDTPDRHRTMRDCIDWSYEQCTPQERTLWCRSSVFVGSFDLAAAEAVCGFGDLDPSDVLDLVAALLDKSVLVRADPAAPTDQAESGSAGTARFRLLETLRQYGRERLVEAGEEDEVLARHADHYGGLVRDLNAALGPEGDGELTSRAIDAELPNLRQAIDPPGGPGAMRPAAIAASLGLENYWESRGLVVEGLEHLLRAVAACDVPSAERVRGLGGVMGLALSLGDEATVASARERLWRDVDELGDPLLRAYAQWREAGVQIEDDDVDAAIVNLEAVVEVFVAHESIWTLEAASILLDAAVQAGQAELAERAYLIARPLAARRSERHLAYLDAGLAGLRVAQGRPEEGVALVTGALRHVTHVRSRMAESWLLGLLATVLTATGDLVRASAVWGAEQRRSDELGVRRGFPEEFAEFETVAREQLGDERLEAELRRGAELDLESLLDLVEGVAVSPPEGTASSGPLSARELEVAALVAEGLTNRAVAERLFITPRTVRGHVENVLAKLGLESRVQIATWFTGREH